MNLLKLVLSIFILHSVCNAATIKQLLNEQNLAIVELQRNEKINIGEYFIISEKKNQCLLEVIKVENLIATVSSTGCSDISILEIGKVIEKSLFDPALTKPTKKAVLVPLEPLELSPNSSEKKGANYSESYKSLVLSYMISPKIVIAGRIYDNTNSESGTLEYTFSNAFKLGYEYSQFDKNSWNNGFLIDYSSLKFDSATYKGNISGTSTTNLSGGITLLNIGYTGKYRWENFFLPVGVAFTSSTVDSNGSFTKTIAARMMLSYGIGLSVSDKFNFELTFNSYGLNSDSVTTSGTTIEPGLGYLTNLQINTKILFK